MSTIVTRAGKGSPLTNTEVDSNFTNLNTDKAELSGATFTGDVASTGFSGDITGAVLFQAKAGEGLTKGDPVYISGISGNQTVVSKADANDANKMPCFGIVDATVSINANCSIVTFGTLADLNTSAFSEGDELYISDTGTLSATAPTGEASQLQKIAKVTRSHASAGSIKVMGAGRTNATPNLDDGKFFLGNSSNQSASATFSTSVTGIALPLSGGVMSGAIITNSTFDGRDVATDGTKLDGIEASATADQTGAQIKTAYEAETNAFTDAQFTKLGGIEASADVTANAGALMDSELTSIASVKALNQGVATGDSPTFAGLVATTADINGGTIDGTVIGGATPAAISGTTGQFGTSLNVDGTATMDGLTVTGADNALAASIGSAAQRVYITPNGTEINYNASGNSAGSHMFQTGNIDRLNIATNGDISFYEDTGTTAKFFWDASAEDLQIGGNLLNLSGVSSGTTGARLNANGGGMLRLASGGVDALYVVDGGNVGIGTSNPTVGKLHINDSGGAILALTRTSGVASDDLGVIRFGNTDIDSNLANIRGLQNGSTTSSALTFETQSTGGATAERMRIDSSGSLSFGGITSATATSDSLVILQGDGYALYSGTAGTGGSNHMVFGNANSWVGSITTNGSATQYLTSSDYRLKENVVPMTGSIDRVKALKPSRFNFITDADKTVDGFLAHEAQAVVPECVTGTKDAMRDEEYEVTAAVYEDVTTPAVEAVAGIEAIEAVEAVDAVYDDEGVLVSEAVEAVEAVEGVEAVEAQEATTESVLTTEAVMGTRSVPDMQGIDQSKLVPLLTAALQEAITKIESLTARIEALEA